MSKHGRSRKFKKCNSLAEANEFIHGQIENVYNRLLDIEEVPKKFEDVSYLYGESSELSYSFYTFMQKEVKGHYLMFIDYLQCINDLSLAMNAIKTENLISKALRSLQWSYESYYKRFDPELCVNQALKACFYCNELYELEHKLLNRILGRR